MYMLVFEEANTSPSPIVLYIYFAKTAVWLVLPMQVVLIRAMSGAPVAFKTWCGHQYIRWAQSAPLVEVGLKWLPKLGVNTSPRPHAHRRTWMLLLWIWGKQVTAFYKLQNSLDLMAKTTSPMCNLVTFISSSGRGRAGAGRPVAAASRSVGRSGCIRADGTKWQDLPPPPIWEDQLTLIPVGADYKQSLSTWNISLKNNL